MDGLIRLDIEKIYYPKQMFVELEFISQIKLYFNCYYEDLMMENGILPNYLH